MANCAYTFTELDGKQQTLVGIPALKAYLVNGGLEQFFPDRSFPWGGDTQSKAPKNTFRYSQEAEDFLVSQFGTGIKNLVNSKTLNFTHGKSAWPEGYRGDEEAVYYNNKAYIDLDATNRDRLKPVLLHEIGEHHNLKKILGSQSYNSLINQITTLSKKQGSEAAKVWAEVKQNYDHLDEGSEAFVSEVIAKLGERNPKSPWYRRILAQIKAFLVTHGLGKGFLTGTMGESDLHALLVASLRSAARGKTMGESSFFGEGMAFSVPENSRLGMHHKDVVKRTPELTEAALKLKAGELSTSEYDRLVDTHKPVTPYTNVPAPATEAEMREALSDNKKPLIDRAEDTLPEGYPVRLRLDIPAYVRSGTWVVTVHEDNSKQQVIGYQSTAVANNVSFLVAEKGALDIASGKVNKYPLATVKAEWDSATPEEAKREADLAIKDSSWVQVGMDPERHSYFYDRSSMRPVVSGDRVIQIGSLLLVKNPVFSEKSNFMFSRPAQSILDETPEASDTPAWKAWSLRVLDKLSIQTDRVASQSLGFLSAKQITEVAQHYLPYAKEYTNLKDLRQGKIDGVLHSTGKLDDVWKNLPKVVGNRVSKLMQDSTLIDATAAKDWTGVEALNNRDEDAPKYLAYTQAKLPENTQVLVKAKAESLGARTIGKDQATFMDEKSANEFVAFLRTKELAHEAFLKATGHGAEYVDRKTKHAAYQAIYKTLPKEAHEVYNGVHTESQKMRNEELDTVEGWINEAVIDVNRREQLKSELRQKFESNNLMWYYQPLSRFGDYWFSGVTSKGEKYFTTFESERGRNQALKEFEQLGGRANGAGKSIKGLKELSQSALSNSLILDVNQEIEAADISLESKTALQDAIYQMYLKSLPDVSMRHKSMNRKGIQGFSEDARRTFAHASHHGASQIANMIYGRKMEKVLKDCSDAIEMMSTDWQVEDAKQKLDAILVLKGRNLEELWGKDYLEKKRDEALANRDDRQASVYTHAISFRNRFKHADLDASIEGLDNLRMHIEHLQEIGSKLTRENSTKATNVVNELSKTFVDMMTAGSSPADRIAMAAKQAGFSWMLGFGLSSGVVNMLQNPIVAGPVIGSKYGHAEAQKALWNSAKLFASVAKDVFHKDADGNFDRRDADGNSSITVALQEQYANDTTLSGAERQLIKDRIDMLNEFKTNGKISRTQTMDQIAVGQVGSDQTSSLAELSKKMGWMFHHGERFNREITLDAAYTLARRDGMDSEAAMAYAGDVVDRAHGDYDAANAARIFRGPVASVAFQFKKYPQMMLFLWGKAARDSLLMHTEEYKKLPAGSPERAELEQQVKEARKLLVGLFTLQAVVGGAVGLPLMGTLEILINALAPDDEDEPYDFEKEVRSGLTAIGGEFLATALMEGIVNAATPINLSSRISLKNVFFQEPLKELEGREAATEYLGQMAGPFGGIVKKLWEGASLISEGNVGRGVEQAAPKFMGDVIKSFRFFNEDARSMNDQKLKEMSSAEIMAQIMGFSSSSLEVKYAERGYVKSSEAAAREYRQKLTNKAARAKMEGSPLPAEEIRAWNAKHPNWKITSDTVKRSITTTKKYEKASGSRGYAINDKLDYLYDEYDLTDE